MPEDLPSETSIRPLLETHTRRRKKLDAPGTPTLFDVPADAVSDDER